MNLVLIRAHAKINLTLDVLSRRADGYHEIDSVMQTISLHDTVTVKAADGITVFCDADEINTTDNIVFKAAKAFFAAAGITGGAYIKIKKRIPISAGLGGGSADAAAVIRGLDRIYETDFSCEALKEIGLAVGADVPFCITGGTARVGGIGEKTESLPHLRKYGVVLVKNSKKDSTADMYKRIDALPHAAPLTEKFAGSLSGGNICFQNAGNAFLPLIKDTVALDAIRTTNPLCATLSGSGPTFFGVYPDRSAAEDAADLLKDRGYSPLTAEFE